MNSKSILATLAYYDTLDYPLTAGEIFKFSINQDRMKSQEAPVNKVFVPSFHKNCSPPPLTDYLNCLDTLVKEGKLEEKNGFYFLPGRAVLYQERIERNKIAEQKWKKARRYLFLAQVVPYIEAIFASGSLALGHTGKESDLDVLVVAKYGRIWTARVIISVLMNLLGVRRKDKERIAPDKICLNHYITGRSLKIPFESMYNAQSYAHLIPIYWREEDIIKRFWEENGEWAKKFLNFWERPDGYQRRAVRRNRFLGWIKSAVEMMLDRTGLAGLLERFSRKIQMARINTALPGRITADDRQLEFHPYSAEKDIIKKYNLAISKLGIFGNYRETDSGLR
ncbi:MAG: hypothetical protein Q8R34_01450 [bacterium]|nr:hypothetical protein [bacterium]